MTFKQKIFISYTLVLVLFLTILFPFASHMVRQIVYKGMQDRALELIERIRSAPNDEVLVRRLKDQKHLLFFRVSVINHEHRSLYDTHINRLLGPKFSQELKVEHPEVVAALQKGEGYYVGYSELLGQDFVYLAVPFDFHGSIYVMRTAYPLKYINELTSYFELGFLFLAVTTLLLFSLMSWLVMNRLTRPIQQMIEAVKSYQEGEQSSLPEIVLKNRSSPSDEMVKLAQTLNSLSKKVQHQIDAITTERNEKEVLLQSLVEGVVAVDSEMGLIYANQRALHFFSIASTDLAEQARQLFEREPRCYQLLQRCIESNSQVSDTTTLLPAGQGKGKLFLDLVAAPIRKNGQTQPAGAVLVMQDKSSHYRILEMRKEFIAYASHELKTPITVIRGFAEALHDNPDLPKELSIEITGKIVKHCGRMAQLIKDLLTLADIEEIPEWRLLECDMYQLLADCCDHLRDAHPTASMQLFPELHTEEEFVVEVDPQLMELALLNLIENGIKYSQGDAQIEIRLAHGKEGAVILSIADRGIGIPQEDLPHIFERFYTVNKSYSAKLGGSGLGLSLVETIVQKHFGKIEVTSQLGVGTCFTLTLPQKRPLV